MQYILFEDDSRFDLLPLTFTRPVSDLRIGIDRLQEKWARFLPHPPGISAWDYLGRWFNKFDPTQPAILLNAKFIPNATFVKDLLDSLPEGCYLVNELKEVVAAWLSPEDLARFQGILSLGTAWAANNPLENLKEISFPTPNIPAIRHPEHLFQLNGKAIRDDVAWFQTHRKSEKISDRHSIVYGADNIFVEPGVKVRAAILNAEDGPIYLGAGVDVQEGSIIHGAHAFCDHSTVNMGAKMRGDTTIGPHSKVGGEVANSVIQGYSNKGHDGYLGNSVIGTWCNLGADTNTSNLKNNYASVRIWSYKTGRFRDTGTQFCGLIMGDHSKCGINTMFNTGTVVGVSANIFGAGYPRNFIPSFSWGGAGGLTTYKLETAEEVAQIVMQRRKIDFLEKDHEILAEVFKLTAPHRRWE
ncbi:MAG: GlmU family protein [Bacteroidia bacterium]|nr:GlmU family protein [Bacteroidia bacterium]